MPSCLRLIFTVSVAVCAALIAFAAPQISHAAEFSAAQRSAIEKIVHDYLIAHPEVLQESITELQRRQQAAAAEAHKAAIKTHEQQLLHSPHEVVLGDPNGKVTFVEFFDYNCPYCKHAMQDMLTLMKNNPKLRVVLKEYPILGSDSVGAARVAIAVRMQDMTGKKYFEFHKMLLGGRGRANEARALAVAKTIGMNMDRIKKDIKSAEVHKTLAQDYTLGQELGLDGTPSYVIGDRVIVGAVGLKGLQTDVNRARCGKATC